ncbi:RsfA family transcriptional regulator [Fodinisporobacter ferrooxydans]|uniref:RsfA family transcriptional regulator n=1 Tax=Fodinisporobacter ferrooxydans TaxID=2901836 RepID=A0ABY4CF22_9BACL|nr:RsfA family transcriptional regulator [Alicyclobacillaceae bacterium MYW30-H2]
MKTVRQDAWAEEDDLLLAEIILRHIREGSTQLLAFEEVGERLGRTAAACGYRWNACVRKQYAAAIEIAKAQRKENKSTLQQPVQTYRNKLVAKQSDPYEAVFEDEQEFEDVSLANTVTWHDVIHFLKQNKNEHQQLVSRIRQLEKEVERYELEAATVRQQYEQMHEEYDHLNEKHQTMTNDYKMLVRIMERARKLTILEPDLENEQSQSKSDSDSDKHSAQLSVMERMDV